MIPQPTIERLVYALVIVLSLIALALVLVSPAELLDNQVVYQGF
jgi:hypothetical protein